MNTNIITKTLYIPVEVDNILLQEFQPHIFKIFQGTNDVIVKCIHAFFVSFCEKLDEWPKNVKDMRNGYIYV